MAETGNNGKTIEMIAKSVENHSAILAKHEERIKDQEDSHASLVKSLNGHNKRLDRIWVVNMGAAFTIVGVIVGVTFKIIDSVNNFYNVVIEAKNEQSQFFNKVDERILKIENDEKNKTQSN